MAINGVNRTTPTAQQPVPQANQVRAAEARGAQESRAEAFVQAAEQFIGQDYLWGGGHNPNYGQMPTDPRVQPVDCSGLVGQAAAMVGANLDGVARDQSRMGMRVPLDQLKAGDLVFRPRGDGAMHVGIYDGKGNVIQAPHTGAQVESIPYNASEWTRATRPWLGQQNQAAATPTQSPQRSGDLASVVRPESVLPGAFDFS